MTDTINWTALLGLTEFEVEIVGWPRTIPVSAKSEESAIAKARSACMATTGNAAWLSAFATAEAL